MARGSNSNSRSGGNRGSSGRTSSSSNPNSGGGRSNYSYYKDFGGYNNFMASYGLKPWDHGDVAEGRVILDAFGKADAQTGNRK